jgi:collagenase-like PrtC family protease
MPGALENPGNHHRSPSDRVAAIEPRAVVVEDFIVLDIALALAPSLAPVISVTCRG